MRLYIQVKPNAKIDQLEKIDESHFKAHVKAVPQNGKANQALINLLSHYFDLPKSFFSLVHGETTKNKVIELRD